MFIFNEENPFSGLNIINSFDFGRIEMKNSYKFSKLNSFEMFERFNFILFSASFSLLSFSFNLSSFSSFNFILFSVSFSLLSFSFNLSSNI